MIDPKTLKAGEVVVFGGKVEKTVVEVDLNENEWSGGYIWYGGIRSKNDITVEGGYKVNDSLWQIAELKKAPLPNALGGTLWGFRLDGTQNNYTSFDDTFCSLAPIVVYNYCKSVTDKLEAAGVIVQ